MVRVNLNPVMAMGYYDPSYGYGGGGTTQNIIGLLAGLGGNAVFPGAGLLLGPLGKMITQMVQRAGGTQDPMNPGGSSGQQPDDSGATDYYGLSQSPGAAPTLRGAPIHYSAGGLPAPGGWGGVFGQGSGGSVNSGAYDYYGMMGLKNLLKGGDASLGFAGMPNANMTSGAPVLPFAKWGGAFTGSLGDVSKFVQQAKIPMNPT